MGASKKRYLWHLRTTAGGGFPWGHQVLFGYVAGLFFVLAVLLANRLMTPPQFIWIPFCLLAVFVGFFWGVGPGLITLILGSLTFVFFIVLPRHNFITWNIGSDFMLFGPFLFAQIIIALLAAQHEVQYRRVLRMRQKLQAFAEELAATNQQLERANHLKDYFVTRAAHELRTPLTTILGEAQLVLRRLNKLKEPTAASLPWKKDIELIEGQARGMNTLVDELIDLSSFRSGEVQLRLRACDFRDLCAKVVENLRTVSGRPLEFQGPSTPVILQADKERLSQLVTNIVRNAIQYSQADTTIQINLSVQPSHALLQVHNDAPELSQEQQEHLFEPFYRTPHAEIMFREGWGLGLTMSKEIAEQHGGHVWAQSFKGDGFSCFVQIPLPQ